MLFRPDGRTSIGDNLNVFPVAMVMDGRLYPAGLKFCEKMKISGILQNVKSGLLAVKDIPSGCKILYIFEGKRIYETDKLKHDCYYFYADSETFNRIKNKANSELSLEYSLENYREFRSEHTNIILEEKCDYLEEARIIEDSVIRIRKVNAQPHVP